MGSSCRCQEGGETYPCCSHGTENDHQGEDHVGSDGWAGHLRPLRAPCSNPVPPDLMNVVYLPQGLWADTGVASRLRHSAVCWTWHPTQQYSITVPGEVWFGLNDQGVQSTPSRMQRAPAQRLCMVPAYNKAPASQLRVSRLHLAQAADAIVRWLCAAVLHAGSPPRLTRSTRLSRVFD